MPPPAVAVGKTLAAQTLGRMDAQGTFVHHRATQPMWPAVMILTQHSWLVMIAQMILRNAACGQEEDALPAFLKEFAEAEQPRGRL